MAADRTLRPPIGLGLGRLVEPVYRAVVRRRNAAFHRGERVERAPVPLNSVGNLSVGGSERKVVRLANELAAQDFSVAIATLNEPDTLAPLLSTSVTRWLVSTFPAATEAGGRAFTTVPSGSTRVTADIEPPPAGSG